MESVLHKFNRVNIHESVLVAEEGESSLKVTPAEPITTFSYSIDELKLVAE